MTRKTVHKIFYKDARSSLEDYGSTPLGMVVTSPPYPMIEMWDEAFSNKQVTQSLSQGDGNSAFELMHQELDRVWTNASGRLVEGGIACINVGDATRKIGDSFMLYPNHSRVTSAAMKIGFQALPEILWRKQSNKPNKFMGSGMLPPGAYVTQEHEYILIFRKGKKRVFDEAEKRDRSRSAFFWEERNVWFSDTWEDLKGDSQSLNHAGLRKRSAAYPFELAYRLVSMFSIQGDWVLDPFLGTGTSLLACMAQGRNSVGFEVMTGFKELIEKRIESFVDFANDYNRARLVSHIKFMENRGKRSDHKNAVYGFPVVTSQETELEIPLLKSIRKVDESTFEVEYGDPSEVMRSVF